MNPEQNSKRNIVLLVIVAIIVVAGAILFWWPKVSNNQKLGPVACTMDAKICPDGSVVGRSGPKCEFTPCPTVTSIDPTAPIINSIRPASGPIGTEVELQGKNLAGFEGDLNAWIENSNGEIGFLPGVGSVPRSDQTIRVVISQTLCQSDNSYSGLPCDSYLTITPGSYNLYTKPWGKMSNKVHFTVTSGTSTATLGTTTAKLGQTKIINGVSITPLQVESDSRCATDVKCVWAGTVTLKTKLQIVGSIQTVTLNLGTPTTFAGRNITLKNVTPAPKSGQPILSGDYEFTFSITL